MCVSIDPEVGINILTWYDYTNGEIGDFCNGQVGTYTGCDDQTYTIQLEYSNAQNGCIGVPPPNCITNTLQPTYVPTNAPTYVPSFIPITSTPSIIPTTRPVSIGAIENFGFENDLFGWSTTGTTSIVTNGCYTGLKCIQLGTNFATNGDSSIIQSFTTSARQNQLSFYYKMVCPDTISYDWATATLVDITAGTTWKMPQVCTISSSWTPVITSVISGHSYTLTLTNHDDNYLSDPSYTLFDEITLSTLIPSLSPSLKSSRKPSRKPFGESMVPSFIPTPTTPTSKPSFQPSSHPTSHPSSRPTSHPTSRPTFLPTIPPYMPPTIKPSKIPTNKFVSKPIKFKPSIRPFVSTITPSTSSIYAATSNNAFFTLTLTFGNTSTISHNILSSQDGHLALKKTISNSVNNEIDEKEIIILSVSSSKKYKNNIQKWRFQSTDSTTSIVITLKVVINILANNNVTSIYEDLKIYLVDSISSGNFIKNLKIIAQNLNLSSLNDIVSDSYTISSLSIITSSLHSIQPTYNVIILKDKTFTSISTTSGNNYLIMIGVLIGVSVFVLFSIIIVAYIYIRRIYPKKIYIIT